MGLVVRKLACDANIHRVITNGRSSILDYGRYPHHPAGGLHVAGTQGLGLPVSGL